MDLKIFLSISYCISRFLGHLSSHPVCPSFPSFSAATVWSLALNPLIKVWQLNTSPIKLFLLGKESELGAENGNIT
jgi:hypothetical protein